MGKATGFMEYERRDPGYRPVAERIKDFKAVELGLTESELTEQAARCMDCGTPFCHGYGCPIANIIPEFNEHVYRGRWKDALDILLETNNFPEFTGRVCPALCEGSCVLGINNEPVAIRQIELAIIEKGFESGHIKPSPPPFRRNERVAVLGSGPAGLTVADTLNRAGYRVVVYDEGAKPGGILRYGIPDFKLEKWVIDRRIRLMEDEGVIFENQVRMGDDISCYYLEHRFDAVCLASGAREPRDIKAPGRALNGIHFAMDFLVQQNKRLGCESIERGTEILATGKNVLVIGGGDTGADCVGTSIRQGAESVTQFEILPEPPPERSANTPWPMWPMKLRTSSSHQEGCLRRWSVETKEFIGANETVRAIKAVHVDWINRTDARNPLPVEKPDSGFVMEADLVLLAMGFSGPVRNKIVEGFGIRTDLNGTVRRDAQNMTNIPGIFAAGDMAQGASLVVRAMQDGRRAAAGIMTHLNSGKKRDISPKPGSLKE